MVRRRGVRTSVGVQALTETTGKAVLARFASLYTGTVPTTPGFIAFTARHRPSHYTGHPLQNTAFALLRVNFITLGGARRREKYVWCISRTFHEHNFFFFFFNNKNILLYINTK